MCRVFWSAPGKLMSASGEVREGRGACSVDGEDAKCGWRGRCCRMHICMALQRTTPHGETLVRSRSTHHLQPVFGTLRTSERLWPFGLAGLTSVGHRLGRPQGAVRRKWPGEIVVANEFVPLGVEVARPRMLRGESLSPTGLVELPTTWKRLVRS